MSKEWLNVRILSWHLHCGDPNWYSMRVSYNGYHKEHGWPDGFFGWYS